MLDVQDLARRCHEANRALCEAVNDFSQKPWEEAEQWQRDSCIAGVEWRLANMQLPACAQHEAWRSHKLADGWVYGPIKDPVAKTHPCLVDYTKLPYIQQAKDLVFSAIIWEMAAQNETAA